MSVAQPLLDAPVARIQEGVQGQLVQLGDLGRARRPGIAPRGGEGERVHHAHHRQDHVAGHEGGAVVELAEHFDVARIEADLLARLAQRSSARVGVAGLDAAAGKADLPGVGAKLLAALGEEHVQPFGTRQERDEHCGGAEGLGRSLRPVVRQRAPDLCQRRRLLLRRLLAHRLPDSHSTTMSTATSSR